MLTNKKNALKYQVHSVVSPRLILCITDIAHFSLAHANNHIAPKDD